MYGLCQESQVIPSSAGLLNVIWELEDKEQSNVGTRRLSSAILKADVRLYSASWATSLQFRFIFPQIVQHSYDARRIPILIPTIPIFILLCK